MYICTHMFVRMYTYAWASQDAALLALLLALRNPDLLVRLQEALQWLDADKLTNPPGCSQQPVWCWGPPQVDWRTIHASSYSSLFCSSHSYTQEKFGVTVKHMDYFTLIQLLQNTACIPLQILCLTNSLTLRFSIHVLDDACMQDRLKTQCPAHRSSFPLWRRALNQHNNKRKSLEGSSTHQSRRGCWTGYAKWFKCGKSVNHRWTGGSEWESKLGRLGSRIR